MISNEKYIPLGPLYLSSSLKKNGHDVRFIDLNNEQMKCKVKKERNFDLNTYFNEYAKKVFSDFNPDIVGVTVHYSGRFHPAIEISRLVKAEYPHVPIVFGGIHPTIFQKEILSEYQCVDFILQGESDFTLVDLVESVTKGDFKYKSIDGLAYMMNGTVTVNAKNIYIDDIDNLSFPDYSLVDIKDYYFDTSRWFNPKNLPINLSIYLLSSRSCPRRCTYCSMFMVHGPKYRPRSAKNVVDEIAYIYRKYNHRYFSFMDDNFTLNKKRLLQICEDIRARGLNIQFDTPNGLEINTLDEEVLEALVDVGMVKTCLAIESGSEEIRNSVNKRIKTEKIFEVLKAIRKFPNLIYNTFFIVGFPNETHETLEETRQLIKALDLKSAVISFATPFPGTKLYEECISNKLIDLDRSDLHNVDRFYFANRDPFIKPYGLHKQDIIDFRLKVYEELNLTKYLESLSEAK